MSNQIIFLLSLILAVIIHSISFMLFSQNNNVSPAGAINKGQGGLTIGISGSVSGNGVPIVSVKSFQNIPLTDTATPVIKQAPPIVITEIPAQVITKPAAKMIVKNITASKKYSVIKHLKTTSTKVTKQVKKTIVKAKKHKIKPQKNQNISKKITTKSNTKASFANTLSTNKEKNKIGTGKGHNLKTSATSQGTGSSNVGGGNHIGIVKHYHHTIQVWLEKHKRYPRMARRRNQQGIATLYFKIDRTGKVLKKIIRKTSGHNILDHEVYAMLQRANPLPPIPKILADTITTNGLAFSIPIVFQINNR